MRENECVEKAIIELGKESAFYNYLFLFIERLRAPLIRTMQLKVSGSGKLQLLFNPQNLANKPLGLVIALLKHECLHIVNSHILIPVRNKREKVLWDLCMDAAVNQYIKELDAFSYPLDKLLMEGCATDNELLFVSPPGFMPGETAEAYHQWALEFMKKNKTVDLELIDAQLNRADSHDDFGKYDLPKEFVEDLLKQVVSETYEKSKGDIPSSIEHVVSMALDRPMLDWRTIIRRFFGASVHVGRYRTPLRPNRRYDDQPGWMNDYAAKLAIIVDTSGSIIDEEFEAFFSEIDVLTKLTDTRMWLIQVDEAVQSVMKYGKGMWRDLKLIGRGETDLQPAVDYAQEYFRPEGILIFTDGYADIPTVSRKVLFVLSEKGSKEFADEASRVYGRSSCAILKKESLPAEAK